MADEHPPVFLSYASQDRERVTEFYDFLLSHGIQTWMDYKFIKFGQNWDFEIRRALNNAALIVIFISNNSVSKRGYVQRELKVALDAHKEKLVDDIYLLPVLLDDDVEIPDDLKAVQYAKASSPNCMQDIKIAIGGQLEKLNLTGGISGGEAPVRWSYQNYRDVGDGLPGYVLEYRIPNLQADEYVRLNEIADIIKGDCLEALMAYRQVKFEPSDLEFSYGQPKWMRVNTFTASCADPIVNGKCLSIVCTHDWYNARAAHPNMDYRTYSFVLDPLFRIKDVRQMLTDADAGFEIISQEVRGRLLEQKYEGVDEQLYGLDAEWVVRGTADWDSLGNFVLQEDGIDFLFPAYQVASYANGPQSARVLYDLLYKLMADDYLYALGLERLIWKKRGYDAQ